MSDLRPVPHWGLWMRLNEPVGLSLRQQFVVHFWANWEMLKQFRDLALSSLVALVPTAALATALWSIGALERRGAAQRVAARLDATSLLVAVGCGLALYLAIQHLFFVYAMQRWYAPYVRREITRRGIPMCERCGHRLPPATPRACPECGVPLRSAQESEAVSG